MKIAVIGAGPAGLTAAWQFAESGHDVTLIERMQKITAQGSGILFQAIGLEALEILGIRQEVEALGQKIEQLNGVLYPSGRKFLKVDYRVLRKTNYAYGVSRTALWNILYEKTLESGVEVLLNTQIESFHYESGRKESNGNVTLVDIEKKQYKNYDFIVDASGVHSNLNKYAERPAKTKVLDSGSLWAKVELPKAHTLKLNQVSVYSDKRNRGIAIIPMGKSKPEGKEMVTLFFTMKWKECPEWDDESFQIWKEDTMNAWPDVAPLIEKIKDYHQLYLAKYYQHTLPIPYGEKIVFIGDAAHASAPQIGLGVNMSIIDALTISRALEQTKNVQDTVKLYAKSRFIHVTFYQTLARMLTVFYQLDVKIAVRLREHLLAIVSLLLMMKSITAYVVSGQLFHPLSFVKRFERRKVKSNEVQSN